MPSPETLLCKGAHLRVFVTGANGHIGSWVVRAAVQRGWSVVGFVRDGAELRGLAGVEVELRRGSLLDAASVRAAMDGADAVIHVGAAHRMVAKDAEDIIAPAVAGTRNVLDAMSSLGVRRLVYTSTGATVGFTKDPARPLDESAFVQTARAAYTRGKIEAERLVLAARGGVDAVVLNPSGVFGQGDLRCTPATRAFVGLLQGDPAFLAIHLTDVRDVAEAHALALERGEPGTRTLIVGDALTPDQLAALCKDVTGIKPSTLRPPAFLLKALLSLQARGALARGSDLGASVEAVDDLAGGHLLYANARSRQQLGLRYRPAREVFTDTVRWCLAAGFLKPRVAERIRRHLGAQAQPDPAWPSCAPAGGPPERAAPPAAG